MLGRRAVNTELRKSLGLSLKKIEMLLITGGDLGEKTFMECCRHLWKANGVELLEPFVEAAFNKLAGSPLVQFGPLRLWIKFARWAAGYQSFI